MVLGPLISPCRPPWAQARRGVPYPQPLQFFAFMHSPFDEFWSLPRTEWLWFITSRDGENSTGTMEILAQLAATVAVQKKISVPCLVPWPVVLR
jgi:hypothetical protein